MAFNYWEPKVVTPIAQVTTVTVGGTLSGETFTISVGGVAIATHTDGDASIATAVAALVDDWNEGTTSNQHLHPYASGITAVDASPDITLTGDTAGLPFVVTLNTPGGSATLGQAATTVATSKHHADNGDNWSEGVVPATNDDTKVVNSSVNICWGLDGIAAVAIDTYEQSKTFTGRIGLDPSGYATSIDGETIDDSVPEYRQTYWELAYDERADIGTASGIGNPAGSQMTNISSKKAGAAITVIHGTAASGWKAGQAALRIWANDADQDIEIRFAPGGVALGPDPTNGTAAVYGDILISDASSSSKVVCGDRMAFTSWKGYGGASIVRSTATVALVQGNAGTITTEGDYTATLLVNNGATMYPNHTKTGGSAVAAANLNAGTTDATQTTESRTWDTVNLRQSDRSTEMVFVFDTAVLTIGTLNDPVAGNHTLTVS